MFESITCLVKQCFQKGLCNINRALKAKTKYIPSLYVTLCG